MNSHPLHREIKSYVLRQGKITQGQKNAITQLLPTHSIAYQPHRINLDEAFARQAPKIIEIGFGMGHATWQIAKNNQQNDYIGLEVHLPGIGALLMEANRNQVHNLKIINHDAVAVIKYMIADNSITGFHVFFPDPWHKKRHHKRRIIQAEFVNLLASKLVKNGYLHLATDWEDYAASMLAILNQTDGLTNTSPTNTYVTRPEYRPLTKFEKRGINLGHKVWDLIFTKLP